MTFEEINKLVNSPKDHPIWDKAFNEFNSATKVKLTQKRRENYKVVMQWHLGKILGKHQPILNNLN